MSSKWRRLFHGTIRKVGTETTEVSYEIVCDAGRLDEYLARACLNKNRIAKAGPFQIRLK